MLASIYRLSLPWLSFAAQFATAYAADLVFVAALFVMCYGCWLAWEPLGFIVFGGMICLPMLAEKLRGSNA